jgi:MoaA/NifB/PqqE/SkfB family radical SAM enzyme
MLSNDQTVQEEYTPKMIVWSLTPPDYRPRNLDPGASSPNQNGEDLSTSECLLVLEGIARLSNPIVVVTGPHVVRRPDLLEITSYGTAVGLKMVIEAHASDISDELMRSLRSFGPRTIRVLLDGHIRESPETRFEQTPEFQLIEKTVQRLREAGFQVHFGATVRRTDLRQLAFDLDYAIDNAARGLYCHLYFLDTGAKRSGDRDLEEEMDAFLERIAELKQFLPDSMYFSPQCVRYQYRQHQEQLSAEYDYAASEWKHWCLGGKTFAFITSSGRVRICSGSPVDCGDLRESGLDFRKIWFESEVLHLVRTHQMTCAETRAYLRKRVPQNQARA